MNKEIADPTIAVVQPTDPDAKMIVSSLKDTLEELIDFLPRDRRVKAKKAITKANKFLKPVK